MVKRRRTVVACVLAGFALTAINPAIASNEDKTLYLNRGFDLGNVDGIIFRKDDISCIKTTGAAIYVACKTKYQNMYESCGHGGESGFAYLSFGSFTNPACPAAMFFGYFDDLSKLREE